MMKENPINNHSLTTEATASCGEFASPAYIMHHMLPVNFRVDRGCSGYTVIDASGKAAVNVEFMSAADGYVFCLDGQDRETAASAQQVTARICQAIDRKLSDWIGQSHRRKTKFVMLAGLNRLPGWDHEDLPMALVSPDCAEAETMQRRVRFQEELDKFVRTVGFGYYQVRGRWGEPEKPEGAPARDGVYYLIYGKPDKKSEQLLKCIAAEFGRKYDQAGVGFRDLNGRIHYMRIAADNRIGDAVTALNGLEVSGAHAPCEKFNSTSRAIHRRNAFIRYCHACWSEEAQTYCFDNRFQKYFC